MNAGIKSLSPVLASIFTCGKSYKRRFEKAVNIVLRIMFILVVNSFFGEAHKRGAQGCFLILIRCSCMEFLCKGYSEAT